MSLDLEDYNKWKAENPDKEHCLYYYLQDRIKKITAEENIQKRYQIEEIKTNNIPMAVIPK